MSTLIHKPPTVGANATYALRAAHAVVETLEVFDVVLIGPGQLNNPADTLAR